MKNWIMSLLSCDASSTSTMRLMSIFSLLVGTALAFVGLWRGADLKELSWLVGIFVTSAFGGKCWQKYFEKKPNPNAET